MGTEGRRTGRATALVPLLVRVASLGALVALALGRAPQLFGLPLRRAGLFVLTTNVSATITAPSGWLDLRVATGNLCLCPYRVGRQRIAAQLQEGQG